MSARPTIYLAADPIEAEIVRNLLAAERIDSDILGALLWSARGDLAADAYPRIVLRDARDEPRARELLREYRAVLQSVESCSHQLPNRLASSSS